MEKLNKSHAKKQHEVTSIFINRPMDRGKVRPGKTQHEDNLTSVTPHQWVLQWWILGLGESTFDITRPKIPKTVIEGGLLLNWSYFRLVNNFNFASSLLGFSKKQHGWNGWGLEGWTSKAWVGKIMVGIPEFCVSALGFTWKALKSCNIHWKREMISWETDTFSFQLKVWWYTCISTEPRTTLKANVSNLINNH